MQKKKVLFLIHTLGAGGAEKVLVNLVNHMSKKYDVTVMTVIDTGIFKTQLSKDVRYKTMFKIPFHKEKNQNSGSLLNKTSRLKSLMAKFYSFIWKYMPVNLLYKIKIKEEYDIEVAFLEGICAKIIAASPQNSKKYSWMHVDIINENKSDRVFKNIRVEKECYQKFDKIVAVSEEVRKQFIKKFDYDSSKIVVKHNAINAEEIVKKANESFDDLDNGNFEIVSIGRLSNQKGYDRLLEVVKKLKKDKINFHLSIIGVGPKEEELKQYLIDNKLEDYVTFKGFKSNPYPYLKNADLFVCSSRAEGFSTVACEATILGVPIVTTDCSGMEELLGDSEYGLITKNNSNSLYEGMKKILNDKKLYDKYKKQIVKIKNRFSIEKSVKEIEEMFGD